MVAFLAGHSLYPLTRFMRAAWTLLETQVKANLHSLPIVSHILSGYDIVRLRPIVSKRYPSLWLRGYFKKTRRLLSSL